MKECVKCETSYELSFFNNNKTKPDGKDHYCKACRREINKARDYKKYNSSSGKVWHENKPEFRKEYMKDYRKINHAYFLAKVQERNAQKLKATPKWRNPELILEIYKEAQKLTELTGIKYEVDHIVPLRNKNVCGLHVEFNLRVVTKDENIAKGNKF